MKFKYISITSVISLAFASIIFAQNNNGIVKAIVYQQEISGGNIPVDMNGQPMRKAADTSFYLVVETKSAQSPKLDKACRGGMVYNLILTDSTQNNQAGLMVARGQIVNAAAGNHLWRYALSLADENNMANKTATNSIKITGTYRGKKINIPVNEIIMLQPELRP